MSDAKEQNFGLIRSFLWPIHRYELKKFMPMFLMLFLVCFNYSILRNMKDSLVVPICGASVIPYIKVWAILPAALISTVLFTILSNRYSQERVFYGMMTGFLSFYILFAFVIYPLRDVIHLHFAAEFLQSVLPGGMKGFVSMVCNWSFTLFYVSCELWGSLIMSVIFWGFANEVTRMSEARRFYSVFSIGSNFAAILAGQFANYFAYDTFESSVIAWDVWELTLRGLVLVVAVSGIITMGLFYWMNKNVLNDPSFDQLHKNKREVKAKGRLSIKESLAYLSNSKYLVCIAVLVIAYNLTINLAEVMWKDQLRIYFDNDPNGFNKYLNNLTSMTGIISTLVALFMAQIITRFGWTRTASITPLMMFITSIGFFGFMIFQDSLGPFVMTLTGFTPLAIAVYFGATQNTLSKAMKYSVFDATKEMAFIPLSHESKLRGKAAIDGVGSRLGKSGGSLIHQGLLMFFVTLTACAPYVAMLTIVAIVGWLYAVRSLGKQFTQVVAEYDEQLAVGSVKAAEIHSAPASEQQAQPAS
jgi:AAA family ATP:ADP antiporter